MRKISRLLLVLGSVGVMVASSTTAQAQINYFRYSTQLWCGPDQHVSASAVTSGPGWVDIIGAVAGSDGQISFPSQQFPSGSRLLVFNSRFLNSYDVYVGGGARVVAHGYGCVS